jgi:hypothetical protein
MQMGGSGCGAWNFDGVDLFRLNEWFALSFKYGILFVVKPFHLREVFP